jgi:hypothetical protein
VSIIFCGFQFISKEESSGIADKDAEIKNRTETTDSEVTKA